MDFEIRCKSQVLSVMQHLHRVVVRRWPIDETRPAPRPSQVPKPGSSRLSVIVTLLVSVTLQVSHCQAVTDLGPSPQGCPNNNCKYNYCQYNICTVTCIEVLQIFWLILSINQLLFENQLLLQNNFVLFRVYASWTFTKHLIKS